MSFQVGIGTFQIFVIQYNIILYYDGTFFQPGFKLLFYCSRHLPSLRKILKNSFHIRFLQFYMLKKKENPCENVYCI